MTKVISLKKEISNALRRKGIPEFDSLGLKEVNFSVRNPSQSIKNTIFKKAGKGLLGTLDNNCDLEDIGKLIVNGPIEVRVRKLDEDEDRLKLLKAINRSENEVYLEVEITDSRIGYLERVLSFRYYSPKKSTEEGSIYLRSDRECNYSVISLELIIGICYIFNEIAKYQERQPEIISHIEYMYYKKKGSITLSAEAKTKLEQRWSESGINIEGIDFVIKEDGPINVKIPTIDFTDFLYLGTSKTGESIRYFAADYKNKEYFSVLYNYLVGLNNEEKNRVKMNRNLQTDYAKSFETKKNIPEHIKNLMKTSIFNEDFKFVEFDELVEPTEISKIEKEWEEIRKTISFPSSVSNSLRFRRLGHYKAGGLYFPLQKSVCVDLDSPSSMIHELMHMVDSSLVERAALSEQHDFYKLKVMYKDRVSKAINNLDDNSPLKNTWNGKTKYNSEYFLSSEEIFARLGEVYFRHVLKIDTSLNGGVGLMYPANEEILDEVKRYYSKLGLVKGSVLDIDEPTISKEAVMSHSACSSPIKSLPLNNEPIKEERIEIDSKMKKVLIRLSENLQTNGFPVDEVQFFELKSYKNKEGQLKQAIKHSQKSGDYSMVYIGEVGKEEYNVKLMMIGENIKYL